MHYHLVAPGKPFAAVDTHTEALPSPKSFLLEPNYPNPFRDATRIPYTLQRPARVTLTVYTLDGRSVATLIDRFQAAGRYEAPFSADGLSAGTYLYRLRTGDHVQSGRMTVVK